MTWVIMEREARKDTEASLVCRVSPDLQAQLVSRELQELLDPVDQGDLLDLSGLLERKDT